MPPVTHVLLDYENVQPSAEELRTLVPEVNKVWVFHGPHQKQVESRFTSFGPDVTAVPVRRTGRNALDFHLSFYMGYIVSRNQLAKIVVVANDKGYDPMLEHAKEMGFAVSKVGHRPAGATEMTMPAPKTMAAKKKTTTKRVAAKKVVARRLPAKKLPVSPKKGAQKAQVSTAHEVGNAGSICHDAAVSSAVIERIVEGLRKMKDKRPAKMNSLRRALKPLLGPTAPAEAINIALNRLIPMGIVQVGSSGEINYPKFAR